MTAYLIIDAGGTFLKSAVLDSEGEVLKKSAFSVNSVSDGTKEEILEAFRDSISKGLEIIKKKKMELEGIGVAFPGPFDVVKATSLMDHKFYSIVGIDLRECFYNYIGVPRKIPIRFIHDANAVLVGEIWKGNAKGFNNSAVVTLGTGLGFAVSKNGQVLYNEIGGPLLSIFKISYKDGILEDYVSKRGILKIYQQKSGITDLKRLDVSIIAKWANEGDEISIETFSVVGEILASAIKSILVENSINCLLFGGQISRSFHLMEDSVMKELQGIADLKKISVVKSIDNAALWGAFQNLKCHGL